MANKKPTIQMIADMAGVSRGTVDRVLNNRGHVRPQIRERIMEAIRETGYLSPRNAYRQNLMNPGFPPLTLGVLLPNWSGHFKWEITDGIEAARTELADFQVSVLVEECQTDIPEENLEHLEALLARGARGLAICTMNSNTIRARIDELSLQGIPIITFNSDLPDSRRICFVGQDYHKSGRIAAELISKCVPAGGRILAAVGNLEFDGHRSRLEGFFRRMEELYSGDLPIRVIETYNDYQLTYKKVLEALTDDPKLTAIYMANRSVSACVKAIETAQKKGALRVICHDISEHTRFLLQNGDIDFSISQDLFQQGYLPLLYLRDYLHKEKILLRQDTSSHISIICSQNL